MSHTIPIQINIDPQNLNIISNNLKTIIQGIEKASQIGVFDSNESESLYSSINNLGDLILIMAKEVENTLAKAEKRDLNKKSDIVTHKMITVVD